MTELSSTLAFNSAKTDILLDVEWESFIDKTNKAVFKGGILIFNIKIKSMVLADWVLSKYLPLMMKL